MPRGFASAKLCPIVIDIISTGCFGGGHADPCVRESGFLLQK